MWPTLKPYFRTTDPKMKLDARLAKAFSEFNKQDNPRFDQYVARKLRAWFTGNFTRFPPTPRVAAGWRPADDDTEGGARRPGGGWGGG